MPADDGIAGVPVADTAVAWLARLI
jgi:hypothetical protein